MTMTRFGFASLAGAILAASVTVSAAPALAGKADDTLNVAFALEPEALDTYKIAGREGLILARHIYDGLLYKDLDTGEIKPALATSWRFVDPTTMEFDLREGVVFHNGAKFSADDVVYTLNTVLDPNYGTRFRIAVDWIEKVEKVSDLKVRIKMAKPFAGAIEMLADALPIYPAAYFKEGGSAGMAAKPVGTGPYRLVEMTPGIRYAFERFDGHYAGSPKGKPAIGKLVVRTIPELNTQFAELLAGKLDWTWRIPPDQASRLASRIQVVSGPIMRIAYVGFAVTGKGKDYPTKNVLVRRAINHAVNREAIVKAFAGGASQVLNAACNPKQFGCAQDVVRYDYAPEKAKALLTEAGFSGGLDIEMVFAAMPRPVAEAIAADLAKVGIRVTLNEQQYAAGVQKWRAGELPAFFTNWGSYGTGDVAFIISNFFGGGADDLVQDKEVIELVATADSAQDRALRQENYAKALKKIAEQAYWLPMYDFNINYGLSPALVFKPHPDEFARWWLASWK
ncbi:ABC transporter substrate-binding protein [Bosea sp. LC85]|uniref:ABC transporter substrate-binding protein n=1 Tax=Bosea sp. LC85 TaxID=1502851 RepID=UPI0004E32C19|nr:ABC transporter substrate-binding protein [Bosea sp. LC85]KFC74744.1 ABC transporter substrate-binding protein [Bosea sp. LC85]